MPEVMRNCSATLFGSQEGRSKCIGPHFAEQVDSASESRLTTTLESSLKIEYGMGVFVGEGEPPPRCPMRQVDEDEDPRIAQERNPGNISSESQPVL